MANKITVKDVAKEAGVSVATVSYVMNDRKDQKISEETRKKVLQIANLLNYRPSHAAKTLATGKTNIIGIAYKLDFDKPARNMEIMNVVNMLIERLNRLKYDVVFLSLAAQYKDMPLNGNIDGIIAIDLATEEFRHLADNYLVPVIAVDMLINDGLFYQIFTDYPKRIKKAVEMLNDDSSKSGKDTVMIMDSFVNKAYNELIENSFDGKIIFAESLNKEVLTSLSGKKVIVIGNYLGLMVAPYVTAKDMLVITAEENIKFIPANAGKILIDCTKKANFAINILLNAVDRKFEVAHTHAL